MTAQTSIPLKWYVPFANGDSSRVELPVTTSDPTRASQTLGFPPLTMQPPESGGVPPQGEDFNGGMNQVARIAWWILNGGGWPYDATFAANSNINGYPNGATLQAADFRGDWISTADNNQNNPDTGSGTAWVPGFQYGTTALSGLTGSTVTPTPAQAAKNGITLAGTLTSALTIVLPNWIKNWTITNNTTGAYVTIVKTAAGSGVTIPQTGQPTRVGGDGTNITQAPENIAAATQPTNPLQAGQALGLFLGVQVFTASSTYTPGTYTVGGRSVTATKALVRAVGAGGAGGGSAAVGASTVSLGVGGGSGAYGELLITSGLSSQTVTIGAGGTGVSGGVSGNAGGSTSFGALMVCGGGVGGVSSGAAASAPIATTPGAPSVPRVTGTGNILINGAGALGGVGFAISNTSAFISGQGASTSWGEGGQSSVSAGINAIGYGGGGGGALSALGGAAAAGGKGGDGLMLVYEYA